MGAAAWFERVAVDLTEGLHCATNMTGGPQCERALSFDTSFDDGNLPFIRGLFLKSNLPSLVGSSLLSIVAMKFNQRSLAN